jgi:ABC-type multidrug transport system fused ATPase/permease subunit
MTAVERVIEYCSLDQEPTTQISSDHRPLSNWPHKGRIIFDNVSLRHTTDAKSPPVLRNISITIESREKIGIVGRTGAGKSSLIRALFRMGYFVDGHIKIDDVNIASVDLNDLRRHISIICQDPVLFTGTIRNNLDPFGHYSDCELWHALEKVFGNVCMFDVQLYSSF